jgi:hypothetical protein
VVDLFPVQRTQRHHQRIHFLARVVKRERGADASFESEMADGLLRAVMSGTHGKGESTLRKRTMSKLFMAVFNIETQR